MMNASTNLADGLNVVSKVFLWCFALGVLFLWIWFGLFSVARDLIVRLGTSMYPVSEHEFLMVNYYGMAFFKLCVLLFFFLPWVAMRLVLRGIRKSGAAAAK
ncbi:MAG: hypothetical protein NTW86_03770 [Candidatus Sumerlaeota bacterium]|nr:hypothetical protein [Candidatus Sumerlaeota bacterium]